MVFSWHSCQEWMKHSGVTGRAFLPTTAPGAVRNQGIRMRALCNREALLTALGGVKRDVPSAKSRLIVDDGVFEDVRVLSFDDQGGSGGSSWLGHLVRNRHPIYLIILAANFVAFGATRWGDGAWAQIVIALAAYAFAAFGIVEVRSYETESEAGIENDSRAASKGQGKIGELKSANRSESLGSNPSSTGDVRPALHGT